MWKKYKLWRLYEPFITGWSDTMIVAVVLWFVGVFWAEQDPAGTFMVCFGGIGLMMGIPVGGFYSCFKSDWIDESIHTRNTLRSWRDAGRAVMRGEDKEINWPLIQKRALQLKKSYPDIPYDFAHMAVILGHLYHTSTQWIPSEAWLFRKENPKTWHLLDYV